MRDETFDPRDLYYLFRRNWLLFSVIVVGFAGAALLLAYQLPRQYKSRAELNIQSSYFQSPLMAGVISSIDNPAELMAQRLSLLRMAVSEEFIEQLAAEFKWYAAAADSDQRARERELLRERIEYYSLSATNYQVTVIADEPQKAQALVQRVLDRMRRVLVAERMHKLVAAHTALGTHVRALAQGLQNLSAAEQPSALRLELEKIERTLAGLLLRFTERHPEVVQLRRQVDLLREQVKLEQGGAAAAPDKPSATGGPWDGLVIAEAAEESVRIYSDLLEKLSRLSILLEIERDRENLNYLSIVEKPTLPLRPVFPNKRMFLLVGLGIGLMTAVFMVVVVEIRRSTFIAPAAAAEALGGRFLGELPLLTPRPVVARRLEKTPPLSLPG